LGGFFFYFGGGHSEYRGLGLYNSKSQSVGAIGAGPHPLKERPIRHTTVSNRGESARPTQRRVGFPRPAGCAPCSRRLPALADLVRLKLLLLLRVLLQLVIHLLLLVLRAGGRAWAVGGLCVGRRRGWRAPTSSGTSASTAGSSSAGAMLLARPSRPSTGRSALKDLIALSCARDVRDGRSERVPRTRRGSSGLCSGERPARRAPPPKARSAPPRRRGCASWPPRRKGAAAAVRRG